MIIVLEKFSIDAAAIIAIRFVWFQSDKQRSAIIYTTVPGLKFEVTEKEGADIAEQWHAWHDEIESGELDEEGESES